MKKNKEKKSFQTTLDSLSKSKKYYPLFFVLILLLYIADYVVLRMLSVGSKPLSFMVAGQPIPYGAITGAVSNLGNICIILFVVFFGEIGFYTALGILLLQFPLVFQSIFVHHNLSNIPGVFGNILTILAIIIIHIRNNKAKEYQAVTDRLTGLPNRFACSELLDKLIKDGKKFALVHIDINSFKGINSTMGYESGNKVLIEIAKRWKNIADTGSSGTLDFVARVNGDEYVLIIRGYHSKTGIMKTIKHYEAVLGDRLTIDGCDFFITASFGYAEYPSDAKTTDSLFSYADAALTEVKARKSSVHILHFTPDLLKTERTLEIEGKIRDALKNDTLFFHLQPQFDMAHKLRGFEALARIKDADGQILSPAEFIPVAEKVGLIDKLDSAVFRKAAIFFGELRAKTGTPLILSVNASVRHLMKNDFLEEMKELLKTSGFPAEQLEIEITESIMIDSAEKALQCINDIRAMGIKLAIDDFGTGYSSLSYLINFPANLLKIDKSFIDKMNSSDKAKKYVEAIISLGHIMGFDVISEGVEAPEQLETLKEIGCDLIQGYIWGRPMPQEDAEQLVLSELE